LVSISQQFDDENHARRRGAFFVRLLRSFALLAVILLALQVGPAAAYGLKSDEGRFSIELPAEPSFQAIDEQSNAGAYVRYQWLVDQGARAWIVT
jgi:hypothetical protein